MTPAARLGAAIEILDHYIAGDAVEKALTNWARRSRYAGSKDRAAVRDIVFQCVRCRASYGFAGGSDTGRGLCIGYAARATQNGSALFSGDGYGPAKLSENELKSFESNAQSEEPHVKWDVPEWVYPDLAQTLGSQSDAVLGLMQSRAPVFVRVNLSKTSLDDVIASLAKDDIEAIPAPLCETALEIVKNPRRLNNSNAFDSGMIELQDAASQAVCRAVLTNETSKILDYCAGGGGKSLALADKAHDRIFAHDINPARMRDIDARARRAGQEIKTLTSAQLAAHGPYDVVLCDVPCSGSGAWRRAPDGKWAFTSEKLRNLLDVQMKILHDAAQLVARDGILIYATCSLLRDENEAQVAEFLKTNSGWKMTFSKRFSPIDGGDGFYTAHLTR